MRLFATGFIEIYGPVLRRRMKEHAMKKLLTLLAATTMLSGAAFAQSVTEKTGVNSTLGISPTTQDFVTEAATSDMIEIQAGKIAQERGTAAEKAFGAQMVTDHTKTSADIKALIASGKLKANLPKELPSSAQGKLDDLKTAKNVDFSGVYVPMQVSAHEDAVSLFERYGKSGDNPALKDWANKTLPALKHHLDMANKLDTDRMRPTVGQSNDRR
jgi:putative membrane protein